MIFIEGENGSGKSAFAEDRIADLPGKRYYVATMLPCGEEGAEKVKKHRDMRKDLHFTTLELPYGVGEAPVENEAVVLLEDVSNLLANVLFTQKGDASSVLKDIRKLQGRCAALVVISIDGLKEGDYEGETQDYIRQLNAVNANLRKSADTVIRMQNGLPQIMKGSL